MAKPKWYSPQLSRELVLRLYQKAKAQRVPMTVLTNRLLEEALGSDEPSNTQNVVDNEKITEPN